VEQRQHAQRDAVGLVQEHVGPNNVAAVNQVGVQLRAARRQVVLHCVEAGEEHQIQHDDAEPAAEAGEDVVQDDAPRTGFERDAVGSGPDAEGLPGPHVPVEAIGNHEGANDKVKRPQDGGVGGRGVKAAAGRLLLRSAAGARATLVDVVLIATVIFCCCWKRTNARWRTMRCRSSLEGLFRLSLWLLLRVVLQLERLLLLGQRPSLPPTPAARAAADGNLWRYLPVAFPASSGYRSNCSARGPPPPRFVVVRHTTSWRNTAPDATA
jgi:hypothetical protein